VAAASAAGAKSAAIAFDDEYTLRLGGVELRMLYFGSAYSDADAVVYFPDLTNARCPISPPAAPSCTGRECWMKS